MVLLYCTVHGGESKFRVFLDEILKDDIQIEATQSSTLQTCGAVY